MKPIITMLFLLFFGFGTDLIAQKPNEILGIAKEIKTKEYYKEQAHLWRQEIDKNPKDGFAWYQHYKAQRAFLQLSFPEIWASNHEEVFSRLRPIIEKAKTQIGSSFEYYLLESVNTREKKSLDFLQKAYQIDANRPEIYESLLIYYVKTFQVQKAEGLAKKMLEQNYYSNATLKWNYNALQTAVADGVFISNGDMDTGPRWVLQYGKGIRKDVLVINKSLLAYDEEYKQTIFNRLGLQDLKEKQSDYGNYTDVLTAYVLENCTRPIYMSCGTDVRFFSDFGLKENIYLLGLAFVYSNKEINNIDLMVDNFEEKYDLEYLLNNFQVHSEDDLVKEYMNITYIPGLMKVKKYFEETQNMERAKYYDNLINKIAEESGRVEEIRSWYK